MRTVVTILGSLLLTGQVCAKDIVLLSGYEPFGKAKTNNSWIIAKAVAEKFKNSDSIEVHTCLLPTTYAGGYPKLEECFGQLPAAPALVLSLGEGPCVLNLETQVYNMDHNPAGNGNAADNAGVRRVRQTILPDGPFNLGLRLDVGALYCSLSKTERDFVEVSATPGNFVCNNSAYQFTNAHPEVPYSFAHVTSQACKKEAPKRALTVTILEKVILKQLELVKSQPGSAPHVGNSVRMMTHKAQTKEALPSAQGCDKEFLTKLLKDQIN